MGLATGISYASGLALVTTGLDAPTVLGTGLALLMCHAIMCRVIAHKGGHPKTIWTVLGLIGGIWAVGVLIALPRRVAPAPPPRPLP